MKKNGHWKNGRELLFLFLVCAPILLIYGYYVRGVWPLVPLYGETKEIAEVRTSVETILDGSCQSAYEARFAMEFPLSSYLIKTYNQLLYDTKSRKGNLVIGKENYLYTDDYIYNYLNPCVSPKDYQVYAQDVKKLQDKLEEQGKAFCYVISPSKAELYPEYLPDRFHGKTENIAQNNHQELKHALKTSGVHLYDTTADMAALKSEVPVFYKTGIHWSYYAAAKAGQQLLALLNQIYEKQYPELHVKPVYTEKPTEVDRDLYDVFNHWKGEMDNVYVQAEQAASDPDYKRQDTLFAMTVSFSHELLQGYTDKDRRNLIFKEMTAYRYFKLLEHYGQEKFISENDTIAVETLDAQIQRADVILMESNASSIPDSHVQFLNYLLENSEQ